jgi:OmpA-OmpF porin, OOP family
LSYWFLPNKYFQLFVSNRLFLFGKNQTTIMKKALAALFSLVFIFTNVFSQDKQQAIRPAALGVSFIMNDFATAQRIREQSLSAVFRDKSWAKFKEMSPGLALTYFKGLKPHTDFAGTLAASYVSYPLRNGKPSESSDGLLLEGDASANFKLLDESYWLTPYVNLGLGGSEYKGYWAAFIPIGLGLKLNLFDEASVFLAGQYRVPVTYETGNYHFMYSFGISGVIGK